MGRVGRNLIKSFMKNKIKKESKRMRYYQKLIKKVIKKIKGNEYPPVFCLEKWKWIGCCNCYGYALNLNVNDRKKKFLIPGCISNFQRDSNIFWEKELISRIEEDLDFLSINYRQENGIKPFEDEWKIAIYYAPSFHDWPVEFHIIRQDKDGSWSEKPNWKAKVRKLESTTPPDLAEYGFRLVKVLVLSKK